MRLFVSLAMLMLVSGCAWFSGHKSSDVAASPTGVKGTNSAAAEKNGGGKLIITAETGLIGKVVRVNETARFAVLNFPVGNMPAAQQVMNVYRKGLKVGEVRVTALRQDNNTVADIVKGEAEIGDEIRVD